MTETRSVPPPDVALEYAEEVRRRLGNRVLRIVLFGSHARGDATEGSDYDFIIVVDGSVSSARDDVVEAGAALLNRRDALCAALVYDRDQWDKLRQAPLGWNVKREGVAL
ncbi:MAG: nucleotidyltransferase domain-containing protein [Planctomycetes bacterium]|nr:nucleotidyltransferase domain-containing protein [Planctomycetota bacterium]